ncbi:MAG: hypothetical protein ACRCYY_06395 [Trueperaceae bacterium]
MMLGFWPQYLLMLLSLYIAGRMFASSLLVQGETASDTLGRSVLLLPISMCFVPFGWHIIQAQQPLLQHDLGDLGERFVTLSLGLGFILLLIGVVWAWSYAFSVSVFPFLILTVYYTGPWAHLQQHLPTSLILRARELFLLTLLTSLGLLAYTLPYLQSWLSQRWSTAPETERLHTDKLL